MNYKSIAKSLASNLKKIESSTLLKEFKDGVYLEGLLNLELEGIGERFSIDEKISFLINEFYEPLRQRYNYNLEIEDGDRIKEFRFQINRVQKKIKELEELK